MRFLYRGEPDKPVVILIHPMFIDAGCFRALIQYLEDDYFVMLPVLSGHYKDSVFESVEEETKQIEEEIRRNHFNRIEFVLGVSLGATVALDFYAKNSEDVGRLYMDGAPIFNVGLLQKIGGRKFATLAQKIQKKPRYAAKKLNNSFPGMGKRIVHTSSFVTKESCINLAKACYGYRKLPIDRKEQMNMTILFGTKETARICKGSLKRTYPNARFIYKIGYSHCGYLLKNPREYAEMLKGE